MNHPWSRRISSGYRSAHAGYGQQQTNSRLVVSMSRPLNRRTEYASNAKLSHNASIRRLSRQTREQHFSATDDSDAPMLGSHPNSSGTDTEGVVVTTTPGSIGSYVHDDYDVFGDEQGLNERHNNSLGQFTTVFASNTDEDAQGLEDSLHEDFYTGQYRESDNTDDFLSLKRDARYERSLKWGILVIMILAASISGFVVFRQLRRAETLDFEQDFQDYATSVLDHFTLTMDHRLGGGEMLSAAYTSDSLRPDFEPLPFITMPDFDVRVRSGKYLSYTSVTQFVPLIFDDMTRSAWEMYAIESQELLDGVFNCTSDLPVPCSNIENGLWMIDDSMKAQPVPFERKLYAPVWQTSDNGFSASRAIMFDLYASFRPERRLALDVLVETKKNVLGPMVYTPAANTQGSEDENLSSYLNEVRSQAYVPVYDKFGPPSSANVNLVGTIVVDFNWDEYFTIVIPSAEVYVVLENEFGQVTTFLVKPLCDEAKVEQNATVEVTLLGTTPEDVPTDFDELAESLAVPFLGYMVTVHPTTQYQNFFLSHIPLVMAIIVAVIFMFCFLLFKLYQMLVARREKQLKSMAVRSGRLISSLFPSTVRQRMLSEQLSTRTLAHDNSSKAGRRFRFKRKSKEDSIRNQPANIRLRTFMREPAHMEKSSSAHLMVDDGKSEPIADLFPETTVIFADIAGFTAWSSEREPPQVFKLLETLYRAFDLIAKRLGVFKVETIGDSYVACTGLPDPNPNHAIVMAKFAYECVVTMNSLVKELEATLGPGTSDLCLRVGIHSGAVTAGVLRGEKARFQLFGDTMNTASRMESTGKSSRIQISQDTADILIASGKVHWIQPREGLVSVKGKGEMQTYWLTPHRSATPSTVSGGNGQDAETLDSSSTSNHFTATDRSSSFRSTAAVSIQRSLPPPVHRSASIRQIDKWGMLNLEDESLNAHKVARLVNWNVEVLLHLLSKVVAARLSELRVNRRATRTSSMILRNESENKTVIDEVTEIISLPTYNEKQAKHHLVDSVPLSKEVRHQLHEYVTCISTMYKDNPFHNLEHASHVTLSANKLMKRIISPTVDKDNSTQTSETKTSQLPTRGIHRRRSLATGLSSKDSHVDRSSSLHEMTFGIASDPLTQFAIVFSALIHDVDHTGLPNAQLVKEKVPVAIRYNDKSVAEQNSVDLAWDLLMEERFEDLRFCIFGNKEEKMRFRQLVVNSVMATDIVDKDLRQLRNDRWEKAFDVSRAQSKDVMDVNRKATIVIEHIIQASDVAHCMQHWHIYCKWNERLYIEMMIAWCSGHSAKDPTESWYGGEIWFFDNYIIPLAKKLEECGVFGVSSDEYLNYALENRQEWEMKGEEVCKTMLESFQQQYPVLWSNFETRKRREECDSQDAGEQPESEEAPGRSGTVE